MDINKDHIKDLVRQARLIMTEGNHALAKDDYQEAYHCYEYAEFYLTAARHLIVEPDDNKITTRTNTSSDQ